MWVKVAYSAFVAVVVPCYWVTYSPWNFLYFCDIAGCDKYKTYPCKRANIC